MDFYSIALFSCRGETRVSNRSIIEWSSQEQGIDRGAIVSSYRIINYGLSIETVGFSRRLLLDVGAVSGTRECIVRREPRILILRYRKASIYSSIKDGTKSSRQPQLCCIILLEPAASLAMQYLPLDPKSSARASRLIFRFYTLCCAPL